MAQNIAESHPELFHYTNAKGLTGIIESQSIWATHYAYLNDYKEIRFFLEHRLPEHLRAVANRFLFNSNPQKGVSQSHTKQQGDRKKTIDSFTETIRDKYIKTFLDDALAEPYIASFCTTYGLENNVRDQVAEHGLLSQWRAYGREGGYAIVFDTEKFCELLKEVSKNTKNSVYSFISDVVYSSDPKSEHIKEFENDIRIITGYLYDNLKGGNKNIEKIYFAIMHCACRYKHWGFKEENEVRLVVLPYPLHHEQFRTNIKEDRITVSEISKNFFLREGSPVPYIDLFNEAASKKVTETFLSTINRIIVGPTASNIEQNNRINSVKMLLKQNGIDKPEVTASEIPLVR